MNLPLQSFVNTVRKSGLIAEDVLEDQLEKLKQSEASPSVESLLKQLIHQDLLTKWQASKLVQGKHRGFFLGQYKLLKLLGKGGMSSVFLAQHQVMRRRCAIKVLPWKLVKDSSYLQRFHREAQAVAAMDHPNIVRAYDIDKEKDGNLEIHFLVMEYVEGQTLFEVVQKGGPLDPLTAADYIRQGALGLDHAHQGGMVHRDVKPGNFIVDSHGTVKLTDLGLARMFEESEDNSLTIQHDERVLGTADFLAPEQAVDSHLVDKRADIYSLGCTFYFLLTGQPPFNEGTLAQRLLAHQTKEPPPLEQFRSDIPPALIALIQRMMAKNREQRLSSAGEVAAELANWISTNGGTGSVQPARIRDVGSPASQPRSEERELEHFLSTLTTSSTSDSDAVLSREAVAAKTKKISGTSSKKLSSVHVDTELAAGNRRPSTSSVLDESSVVRSRRRPKSKRQTSWLVIGIAAVVITSLAVAAFLMQEDSSPQTKPTASLVETRTEQELQAVEDRPSVPLTPSRPVTDGILTVGANGHFTLLADALNYVVEHHLTGSSDRIGELHLIGSQVWNEPLVIDNSGFGRFPSPFRIIGPVESPSVLSPETDGPVILLDSVEQLTLENMVIRCQNHPIGVVAKGFLTGTRLKNIQFQGIQKVGFSGKGVSGLTNDRLVLENCTFQGASPTATSLRIESTDSANTREVLVDQCRFLGPMNIALDVVGTASSITLQRNRFFDVQDAIRFDGAEQVLDSIQILNNTFHRFQRGVVFQSGPSPQSSRIEVARNLFSQGSTAEIVITRPGADPGQFITANRTSQMNWSDQTRDPVSANLDFFAQGQRGIRISFVTEDPTRSDFLRPRLEGVQTTVLSPDSKLNYVGAVRP